MFASQPTEVRSVCGCEVVILSYLPDKKEHIFLHQDGAHIEGVWSVIIGFCMYLLIFCIYND